MRVADVTRERTECARAPEGAEGENVILRGRVENWERENLEVRSLAQRERAGGHCGAEWRGISSTGRSRGNHLRRKIARIDRDERSPAVRLTDDEATDHITADLPWMVPRILPHEFAAMCEDLCTALRSMSGRTRVSRRTPAGRSVLNPSAGCSALGTGTPDSLSPMNFIARWNIMAVPGGAAEDAEHGFRALCTRFAVLQFRVQCAHTFGQQQPAESFAALTDGTDRFPTDTALNVQLATFFIRSETWKPPMWPSTR